MLFSVNRPSPADHLLTGASPALFNGRSRHAIGVETSEEGRARVDSKELQQRLRALSEEHRDLDSAIDALRGHAGHDQLQLARLKKRKLKLRDEIAQLGDLLLPDIIA